MALLQILLKDFSWTIQSLLFFFFLPPAKLDSRSNVAQEAMT